MSANCASLKMLIQAQSESVNQLAERFFEDALKIVARRFKDEQERLQPEPRHYAARYPEVVASLMQVQAMSFHTLAITEALHDIKEEIGEQSGELLGVAESAGIQLSGIEQSFDRLVDAVRLLDKA